MTKTSYLHIYVRKQPAQTPPHSDNHARPLTTTTTPAIACNKIRTLTSTTGVGRRVPAPDKERRRGAKELGAGGEEPLFPTPSCMVCRRGVRSLGGGSLSFVSSSVFSFVSISLVRSATSGTGLGGGQRRACNRPAD